MAKTFTCLSCINYRKAGCAVGKTGFPSIGVRCVHFSYAPGSDELEDK